MRQAGYYFSRHLGVNIEFIWYGTAGKALILFPTSGGSQVENEDQGLIDSLRPAIDAGRLQAVCVNSINNQSWGDNTLPGAEKLRRHELYDQFLAEEFVPFVTKHSGQRSVMVYGASMGGYHAVNFAARHPDLVSRCIALSGLFDANKILKGHWEDRAYFHSPLAFIPNMDGEWIKRLSGVEWVIATGETDSLADQTRALGEVFKAKRIPATVELWPGVFGHDWPFWKQHLPRFI